MSSNSKIETSLPSTLDFLISIFEFRNPISKWIAGLAMAIGSFASCGVAYAQGCAMCYNTAAAAKAAAIRALQSGILILLVPPALMFIGIFVLAFRSRERFEEEGFQDLGLDRELKEWLSRLEIDEAATLRGSGRHGDPRRPAQEYAAKMAAPPKANSCQ